MKPSANKNVITGQWTLEWRPTGKVEPEKQARVTVDMFVKEDGSATVNVFTAPRTRGDVALGRLVLPAPVGAQIDELIFGKSSTVAEEANGGLAT